MKKITLSVLLCTLLGLFSVQAQFHESFDDVATPAGWTVINQGSTQTWRFGTPPSGTPHSGDGNAYIRWDTQAHDDYLVTPQFTVTAGVSDQLRFYGKNLSTVNVDKFDLLLSTTGTAPSDFTVTLASQLAPPTVWTEYVYNLSAYEGQDVYVAFKATSTNKDRLDIDDVYVENAPTCPKPLDPEATVLSMTEVEISWTEAATATEWEVIYGPAGFDPQTEGTTVADDDGTLGVTLTGLTPDTNYEFYVRAICGPGDESLLSDMGTFFTGYCAFSSSTTTRYIDDFITTGAVQNISNTNSGQSPNGYGNFTAMAVETFSGGDFDFTANFSDGTYGLNIWVDFNNDLVFEESEKIFATGAYVSSASGNIVIPAGLANGDYRIRVVANYFSTNPAPCGDFSNAEAEDYTLTIGDPPACAVPADFHLVALSADSADLEWTPISSETEWEVNYGAPGFDPDTEGTSITVTPDPEATISGLTENTAYEVYVRAICGPGEESNWRGPLAFTTPCVPATIPFLEGFETGYTHDEVLAGCWTQTSVSGSSAWTVNSTNTTYNRTPRTGSYNVTLRYSNEDWMFYALDLTGGMEYQLEFFARQNSSDNVWVEAAYGTVNDPSAMTNVIIPETLVVNGDYQRFHALFTPATSGTYYLGIKGRLTSAPWYLSIDDISVMEPPTCPRPSDLTASGFTANSAVVSWTPGGTETEWDVVYGPEGFDPATEGTTVNVDDGNPQTTLTGLTDNTSYQFYVRAICGAGDESILEGPASFTTPCLPAAIPFLEGFETGYTHDEVLAGCWTQTSVSGSSAWTVNSTNTTYNRTPRTGSYNVTLRYSNEDWMFYALDLTGGMEYQLEFFARQNSSDNVWVEAAYGTVNDPSAMTNVIIPETLVVNGDYQRFHALFTPATSGTYYLGIKGRLTSAPWYLSIDDISVMEPPTCPRPSDLTASGFTANSAVVSWTPGGTETEWDVVYGPEGFDPATEGTTVNVDDGNPQTTLTGLTDNTSYQFYVRAICGAGDESILEGPASFTTACLPTDIPYLLDFEEVTPPALPACTSVENVGTGNVWETASVTSNGFYGKVLRYKYDFNNPADTWFYTQGLNLTEGTEYVISYKFGSGSSSYTEKMKVAYGTSPDAASMTEQLADYPNISSGAPTFETIIFTVPADGVYYFGFNAYSDTNQLYLYLDDISIDETPDCEPVTNIEVTEISTTSAVVSWTASPTAIEGYTVDVFLAGADPTTDPVVITGHVGVGVESVFLTDLEPDTSYDVYVTSDCGDIYTAMSSAVTFTTLELGVGDNALTKVVYYPNPVKEQLTLTAPRAIDQITVYNLLGQTLMQLEPRGTTVEVDMSALPAGAYVVKASVMDATTTFRVLKQ